MTAESTPAGWYPDVERPGGERYWDGSSWTEQRRDPPDAAPSAESFGPPPGSDETPFGSTPGAESTGSAPSGPGFGGPPPSGPPSYGAPPSGPPAGFGQPVPSSPAGYAAFGTAGQQYAKSSAAAWSLGLSITGLVLLLCCGIGVLASIPGAIIGWKTMKDVDRGEKDPSSRGAAKAGFVVGIVGIVLSLLVLIAFVAIALSGS